VDAVAFSCVIHKDGPCIKIFTKLDAIEQARSGTRLQVPESLTVVGSGNTRFNSQTYRNTEA
jgi:hypothetical protein